MQTRTQDEPEKAKLCKSKAKHPLGIIKGHMDQVYFLMKGLPNVGAEISLAVRATNIKRAAKILGVSKMFLALV